MVGKLQFWSSLYWPCTTNTPLGWKVEAPPAQLDPVAPRRRRRVSSSVVIGCCHAFVALATV